MLQYLPFIGKAISAIFGSKEKRDKYDAEAKAATSSEFAAEFGHSKNWFDSLIDGLNRLPRPIFAFGTIYLFVLCWTNPETFVAGAVNLELMPQEMWWILGTIVVFFFGGRLHKDFGEYKIKKDILAKYQKPTSRVNNAVEKSMEIAKERKQWDSLNR